MSSSSQTFLAETKKRKLRRVLSIYAGITLPAIGIANMLESRYALSPVWFDRFLLLLVFGFLLAGVIAWYHGKKGHDRFQRRELVLYGVIGCLAIVSVIFIPARSRPIRRSTPTIDRSIAVLPFKNLSGEADYFSDGITEDILTRLSKIHDLRVISHTTMLRYRESTKTMREIGDELNVAAVLEGSVRQSGNRVRIVGQLVNASTDEHLWAETYDRELKDVFQIQGEVASGSPRLCAQRSLPGSHAGLHYFPRRTSRRTTCISGRGHYNLYTASDNERAITFFQEALNLDPDYALALAGLGDAYSQRVLRYGHPKAWLDSALAVSERALTLDPELAEGHKALALAYDNLGQMEKALPSYEQAIALNPNFAAAIANVGIIHYRTGRLDRALSMAVTMTKLAPDEAKGYVQVGMDLQALGVDSSARVWYQRARSMDPNSPIPVFGLGWLELTAGDAGLARQMADTMIQIAPRLWLGYALLCNIELVEGNVAAAYEAYKKTQQPPSALSAYILHRLDRMKESRKHVEATLAKEFANLEAGNERRDVRLQIARAYAVDGKTPEALDWLERSTAAGLRDYRWTRRDPVLSSLHGNHTFDSLMTAMERTVTELRESAQLP